MVQKIKFKTAPWKERLGEKKKEEEENKSSSKEKEQKCSTEHYQRNNIQTPQNWRLSAQWMAHQESHAQWWQQRCTS